MLQKRIKDFSVLWKSSADVLYSCLKQMIRQCGVMDLLPVYHALEELERVQKKYAILGDEW